MSITRKIQVRRGTTSQWSTANPTLSAGEFGYDSTLKKIKIGDGSTAWASLPFAAYTPAEVDALLEDYATTADVNAAIVTKQDILSRDPVGDYGTFGMLVMQESTFPRGNNSLTTEQQATYERAWGVRGTVGTQTSDAGTYYDNYMVFGFNPFNTVHNEGSVHLTFESEWTNTGLAADYVMEWHIDGKTRQGTYHRMFTGTMPKDDSQDPDATSNIASRTAWYRFLDWDGNGILSVDARGGEKHVTVDSGTTIDFYGLDANRKGLRQLVATGPNVFVNLPYATRVDSTTYIDVDYGMRVTGGVEAAGQVTARYGYELRNQSNGARYWINFCVDNDATQYIYNIVNSRAHIVLQPGANADASNTTISSKLTVEGELKLAVDKWVLDSNSATRLFFSPNAQTSIRGHGSANVVDFRNTGNTVVLGVHNTGALVMTSIADASAPNNSLYFSSTASKLVYKDSGGVVNNLY